MCQQGEKACFYIVTAPRFGAALFLYKNLRRTKKQNNIRRGGNPKEKKNEENRQNYGTCSCFSLIAYFEYSV